MTYTDDPDLQIKVDQLLALGQEHLFAQWSNLSLSEREIFLQQIADIDLAEVREMLRLVDKEPEAKTLHLEPTSAINLSERADKDAVVQTLGEDALRKGQVAAFLVAGGQGSRLGFEGPKGMFPITPIRNKSLFQLFAEKLINMQRRYETTIPWYIMTSQANNSQTRAFFEEHDFFGLSRDQVRFFPQQMLPAFNLDKKILMADKNHIFFSPNGHGGSLQALYKNKALDEMRQRGIKHLFYFQVDNVLLRMCDPVFIGYHIQKQAQMSTKVIRKTGPEEKMGILCKINGAEGVVEYSDLSPEDMYATMPDGSLKYWAGNTAIHMFDVDFLYEQASAQTHLPYHRAVKKVTHLNRRGQTVQSDGIKFEFFIFDLLLKAKNSFALEVDRHLEFSAVKNKSGKDSPQTAKNDLLRYYRHLLSGAGIHFADQSAESEGVDIEISPLFADSVEELQAKRDRIPQLTAGACLEAQGA